MTFKKEIVDDIQDSPIYKTSTHSKKKLWMLRSNYWKFNENEI